jgi:serine/threonine protein phosphatase PrpC
VSIGRARVAAATVPGAVHLRNGRRNEDAVAWLPANGEGERVVMAVSDGHGSAVSPRSALGSAIAVNVTTELLWQLPHLVTADMVERAVGSIVDQWTRMVSTHLERHPLTPAELEGAGVSTSPGTTVIPQRPTVTYGATLLFAVVSTQQLVLGQIGDGDVLLVGADGRAVRPLPLDTRLVAHVTTSLSDDDAVSSTRTMVLDPADNRLVLLSSDGYANSFATDDAFLQVGCDVLRTVEEQGIGPVRQSLPRWLAETTLQGSGDDISVAIAVLDRPPPSPDLDGDTRRVRGWRRAAPRQD